MEARVLIVGAGPVGLGLAAELALHRIPALVIEQNPRTGQQPRAKTTNVRSMEHMRRWGIAEDIRAAAPFPAEYGTNISFRTRLFGQRLAGIENAFYGARPVREALFSEPAQWIPQYKVEAVLRAHAETSAGIELRFNTRLETLEQTDAGVTATIRNLETGTVSRVDVAYVVGADGARSTVRGLIGARMEGEHAYAQHIGLVMRAPALRPVMREDPAIMYWLINRDSPAVTAPMDKDDLWSFGFSIGVDETVNEAGLPGRVEAAFGRNVAPEILTIDPWAAHSLLATHYSAGRVFLAGDACHLHPPFGGYGMNLGIADAVDLGWKLSAVLQGWGGAKLLASYEPERRKVHRRVIDEAVANHAVLPHNLVTAALEAPGPEGDAAREALGARVRAEKLREFRTLGVVLGYHYSGSAITVPDGTDPPEDDYLVYKQSAHPGCLAPHAWLQDGRSLYDLFGPDYTLLIAADGAEDAAEALQAAAKSVAMPLNVATSPTADLYGAHLALIRPDQHVAWRGDALRQPAAAIIDRVRGA
jgi:2-polyprenyl-6-methoxyphenol hydroxylase-like FAD-dependent oxidoreductase